MRSAWTVFLPVQNHKHQLIEANPSLLCLPLQLCLQLCRKAERRLLPARFWPWIPFLLRQSYHLPSSTHSLTNPILPYPYTALSAFSFLSTHSLSICKMSAFFDTPSSSASNISHVFSPYGILRPALTLSLIIITSSTVLSPNCQVLSKIIFLPFRKSVPTVYLPLFLCMFIQVARILSWILLSEKPAHD